MHAHTSAREINRYPACHLTRGNVKSHVKGKLHTRENLESHEPRFNVSKKKRKENKEKYRIRQDYEGKRDSRLTIFLYGNIILLLAGRNANIEVFFFKRPFFARYPRTISRDHRIKILRTARRRDERASVERYHREYQWAGVSPG